jgi:hypothetical protein
MKKLISFFCTLLDRENHEAWRDLSMDTSEKMTKNNESSDRERSLDRQLRIFERRLTRLEETQLTGREVNLIFSLFSEKVDMLEEKMNQRLDWLEERVDRLEVRFNELDRKCDLAISGSRDRSTSAND